MVCLSFQAPTNQQIAAQRREETRKAKHNGHVRLPGDLDRRVQNTPWTEKEYGGRTPQETYAASDTRVAAMESFRTRELAETIRGI
jgi:hypothetical protein